MAELGLRRTDAVPLTEIPATKDEPLRASIVAVAMMSLCACDSWTDPIYPNKPNEPIENISDAQGKPCLTTTFIGAKDTEVALLRQALSAMCSALRDPEVAAYIGTHVGDLKPEDLASIQERNTTEANIKNVLEPSADLRTNVTRTPRKVDFYLVVGDARSPGLSEICVGRDPSVRAIRISRNLRMKEPTSVSSIANTLAHELVHLHQESADAPCRDRFIDSGGDVQQCRSLSYVIGNASACSIKRGEQKWAEPDWRACMIAEANVTPGYQSIAPAARSAFGCD